MTSKRRADAGANRIGSNTFDLLTGNQSAVSVLDCNVKPFRPQRICICGKAISQDEFVFNNAELCQECQQIQTALEPQILDTLEESRKIVRLYRCFGCQKSFSVQKMSHCLAICKSCYVAAQDKGKVAQNNFIETALRSFGKFLRRQI